MTTPASPSRAARPELLHLALALPGIVALAGALMLVMMAAGGTRLWGAPASLTLPEAAALRDLAEIVRQVEAGVDPNAIAHVRGGMVRSSDHDMTPLEAAVGARELAVFELLLTHGARLDAGTMPALVCFARQQDADAILEVLTTRAPDLVPGSCEGIRLPW